MAQTLRATYPELDRGKISLRCQMATSSGTISHRATPQRQPGPDDNRLQWLLLRPAYIAPFLLALQAVLDQGQIPRQAVRVRFVGNVGQVTADQVQARAFRMWPQVVRPDMCPTGRHNLGADMRCWHRSPGAIQRGLQANSW